MRFRFHTIARFALCAFSATLGIAASSAFAVEVNGAGAGSPLPLYAAWADAYRKETGHALLFNFRATGSGDGIQQIKARTVDFAASDVPLSPTDLTAHKLVHFPVAVSGVVPIVNIPGVRTGDLKLTGKLLSEIFLGSIKKWNSPAIAELNRGIRLPDMPIRVYGRSDGAGTTYHYTYYLSHVDPEWKRKFGYDFRIQWPAGTTLVGSVKEMVAAVAATPGAIGYAEYGIAAQGGASMVQMRNANGIFVAPSLNTFRAALAASTWVSKGAFEDMLADMPGQNSWPITAGTYIIVPQVPAKPEQVADILKFYSWCFSSGDRLVETYGYMPLPERVQTRVMKEMAKVTDASGAPLMFTR